MVKISVIIATYNQANYLGQAIDSVLAQTYPDFELIIVDDGSTDLTQDIVAAYQDSRIHYYWQENQERSAARNLGISLSQGQYITFLDGDDCYLRDKLALQVTVLDAQPEIDMVISGWIRVDDRLNPIDEICPWYCFPFPALQDWLYYGLTVIGANLIRCECLVQVGGFNKDLHAMEDTFLWYELIRSGCKTAWLQSVVMMQRMHPSNTIRNAVRMREANLILLEKIFLDESIRQELSEPEAFALAYLNSSFRFLGSGQIIDARIDLSKAIQSDPTLLDNNGEKILVNIWAWANDPIITAPEKFIQDILDNLPNELLALRWNESKVHAGRWIAKGFNAYQLGDVKGVRSSFLKALVIYPGWIKNRGVLSYLIETLVGKTVTDQLRRF